MLGSPSHQAQNQRALPTQPSTVFSRHSSLISCLRSGRRDREPVRAVCHRTARAKTLDWFSHCDLTSALGHVWTACRCGKCGRWPCRRVGAVHSIMSRHQPRHMQGPLCIQQRTSNDALPGFAYRSISDFPKLSRTAWWLKTQAIFAVIPRQGISSVKIPRGLTCVPIGSPSS